MTKNTVAAIDRSKIDPVILKDIQWLHEIITRYKNGEINEDGFAPKRLLMGIYGQRQEGDNQMIRIKIPYGALNTAKLKKLAQVVIKYGNNKAHFTTRENIQTHFIKFDDLINVMNELAEAGLFTREACGNTVRNIIGCPLSGVCRKELFDITPFAHSLVYHILRKPEFINLPRKFKISLSGCPTPCRDCKTNEPVAFIHDMGFVADIKEDKKGFKVWVGGGLGNTPKFANLLEEFTPLDEIIRTTEAILRVFNELGDRQNKNRARLKFLVQKIGFERFKKLVFEKRASLEKHHLEPHFPAEMPTSPIYSTERIHDLLYDRWINNNVIRQKQSGYNAVVVILPIGDVTGEQLLSLSDIAYKFSDGFVRSSPAQNIILRWIRNENLPALYLELQKAGLAEASANTIFDITSCPGASSCKIAITHSKNIAGELRNEMFRIYNLYRDLNLTIKISGCPNACGQHHIADIGLYGVAKKLGGNDYPAYQVMAGGGLTEGKQSFGIPLGKIIARLVPDAVKALAEFFKQNRVDQESFHDFVGRVGKTRLQEQIQPFIDHNPGYNGQLLRDVGTEEDFKIRIMEGECAK